MKTKIKNISTILIAAIMIIANINLPAYAYSEEYQEVYVEGNKTERKGTQLAITAGKDKKEYKVNEKIHVKARIEQIGTGTSSNISFSSNIDYVGSDINAPVIIRDSIKISNNGEDVTDKMRIEFNGYNDKVSNQFSFFYYDDLKPDKSFLVEYDVQLSENTDETKDYAILIHASDRYTIYSGGWISEQSLANCRLPITIKTAPIQKDVEIKGLDEDTLIGIPDAKVEVYDKENNAIETGYTNENGALIIQQLSEGDYSFREVEAPEGYYKNENIFYFSIGEDGEVTGDTVFFNKKIKVYGLTINYIDKDTNKLIHAISTTINENTAYNCSKECTIEVPGYVFDSVEGNLKGIIKNDTVVNVYYVAEKDSCKLNINYIDTDTNKIIKTDTKEYEKGSEYDITDSYKVEIDGYDYAEITGELKGIILDDMDISVYYKRHTDGEKDKENIEDGEIEPDKKPEDNPDEKINNQEDNNDEEIEVKNSEKIDNLVQTGDNSHVAVYGGILLISILGLVFILYKKRK